MIIVITVRTLEASSVLSRSSRSSWSSGARAEGVDLLGPDELLAGLTRRGLETDLDVEMSERFRGGKHPAEGRNLSLRRRLARI